ncbi:hypothetical protein BDR07DRAFT_1262753, partial [Suillus spraguei]
LSAVLSSLPQAKSMDSVSLHPNMYAQRAAESEAKVLSSLLATPPLDIERVFILLQLKNPHHNPNSPNSSPPLMMRKS